MPRIHPLNADWSDLEFVCRRAADLTLLDGCARVVVKHTNPERWNYIIREYPKDKEKILADGVVPLYWTIKWRD